MNKFIVRQPIKTPDGATFGYEIVFSVENELYNQNRDYAAAENMSSFLLQNSSKVVSKGITFMTVTPNLLFKSMPKMFKPGELVIQIEDNIVIHPLAETIIKRYRDEGYKFCINEFQFAPRYFALLEYVDYIKIDVNIARDKTALNNIMNFGKGFKKKCIITGINDADLYEMAKYVPADYYQGTYIAEAMVVKSGKSEYLKSNFFQLVVAVNKEEPDIEEIEDIVKRDAFLTYALLKMVNSVHFALRHKTSSIKQAIAIVGLSQLRQWVYLLSFGNNEINENNGEILKLSYQRANFCQELCGLVPLNISKSDAYLMGILSTLDVLVDAPIEEIIEEIPLNENVKEALINHSGSAGTLLKLVLSYEKADWKKIKQYASELDMRTDSLAQVYFDCLEQVNIVWESIINSSLPEDDVTQNIEEVAQNIEEKIDEISEIDEINDIDNIDDMDKSKILE